MQRIIIYADMQQDATQSVRQHLASLEVQLHNINEELVEVGHDYDVEGQVTYIELLNKREHLEQRIEKIKEQILKLSQLEDKVSSDTVANGSKVKINDGSAEFVANLVDDMSSMALGRFISAKSPLGQALIGRSAGDNVVVSTPTGEKSYKLLEVL